MKTALITGANRGIGAEMLAQLNADGVTARGTARDPSGDLLACDVADAASVTAMATAYGDTPLDLLVCNAGIFIDRDETIETGYPADMWAEEFATNVTGVFLTIQALLPNLRAAKGKIAIISSQLGSSTQLGTNGFIYRASKAAVLNLGMNVAQTVKPDGIAVGIYHPGWVQTDMGGESAAITPEASASGLIARFKDLSLDKTGCFENWDGRPHAV
ncbi:SDR family NAD(P)-dependent oxidoreductase [Yoonia sp. 208BN28-4]|uniref:SDR family NAD(P)-dependent oxidoreductase n=1 Tax=Yoonia sp. 208BN28-4 TaxID=3126505 RepID=UPI0030B3E778